MPWPDVGVTQQAPEVGRVAASFAPRRSATDVRGMSTERLHREHARYESRANDSGVPRASRDSAASNVAKVRRELHARGLTPREVEQGRRAHAPPPPRGVLGRLADAVAALFARARSGLGAGAAGLRDRVNALRDRAVAAGAHVRDVNRLIDRQRRNAEKSEGERIRERLGVGPTTHDYSGGSAARPAPQRGPDHFGRGNAGLGLPAGLPDVIRRR